MKTKIDIVLELVRQGKVTNEEAKILMATEKEYVYYPNTIYPSYPVFIGGTGVLNTGITTTYMQYPSTCTAN